MNIRSYIKKYALTREEFCYRCKISMGTLQRILHGAPMHQKTARRIEKATAREITVMELCGRDERFKKVQQPLMEGTNGATNNTGNTAAFT